MNKPCNCGLQADMESHYRLCASLIAVIETTVEYGGTNYPVRLERQGSGREWTFAGYVPEELHHIGNSLVVDAVAQHTGVTPEEIRRECSSTSYRNGEFCHVVFCRRGERPIR